MLLQTPYLLFLGDAADPLAAKVAQGIKDWRPDQCIGQFRQDGCKADLQIEDLSIAEAYQRGAKTLVVGVANRGGVISESWLSVFEEALNAGMDIASGLHNLLGDEPRLQQLAKKTGGALIDVRIPQNEYPIASGVKRSGKRCLAVGTDCSVGKMYTALALETALHKQGKAATFRATGQTGILITGNGVPLDAVVADFMAGAVEWLTPDNDATHWDLIEGQGSLFHASYSGVTLDAVVADFMAGAVEWLTPDNDATHWDLIEGQGSLFHASYSGVTLALIHGGAPDALILCHEPTREHMRGLPDYSLPTLEQLRDMSLSLAHVVNPVCEVVGISVNTAALSDTDAKKLLSEIEARMGLPTVDPFRDSADRLASALS